MWSKTYSKKVAGLKVDRLWKVWSDVNQWHTWQDDIEYAKMDGEFTAGNTYKMKPRGGPEVSIELSKVEPNRAFADLTRFPLATMHATHEFIQSGAELEIKTTVSIEGALSFVWRKIVAEGVANSLPEQTDKLIQRAKNG